MPRRLIPGGRRLERALLGMVMSAVAFVAERRLVRALSKRS
ncbi:MAG: hypothetical protein WBB74_03925 [Gaiellaceae bacterium]